MKQFNKNSTTEEITKVMKTVHNQLKVTAMYFENNKHMYMIFVLMTELMSAITEDPESIPKVVSNLYSTIKETSYESQSMLMVDMMMSLYDSVKPTNQLFHL